MKLPPSIPFSTSLTITNPLHLYRSHLASKRLLPDQHQHRTALILQDLYLRLKDYTPPPELDTRLHTLVQTLDLAAAASKDVEPRQGLLDSIRTSRNRKKALSLVRMLSSADTALELDTPKGLLLHGEVGTGKSMLMDLLYTSLPTSKKHRWHFNTFMLRVYSFISSTESTRDSSLLDGSEYVLLKLARRLIAESPILFLDEFQLPDRASAKIVSSLLVNFWGLGGVLVGTSNRLPGELVKAAGTGREGEFRVFEEVLGARCESWKMGGAKDWRREEREWWRVSIGAKKAEIVEEEDIKVAEQESGGLKMDLKTETEDTSELSRGPKNYFVYPATTELDSQRDNWEDTILTVILNSARDQPTDCVSKNDVNKTHDWPWEWEKEFIVYGRNIRIPKTKNSVAVFDFNQLCGSTLGPADYITITSHFHTIFIDAIPILTHSSLKNEARRFITLLDAIYEAGARLAIRVHPPPTATDVTIDDLFFPDEQRRHHVPNTEMPNRDDDEKPDQLQRGAKKLKEYDMSGDSDALYPETYSESHQDLTSPFRPNISIYHVSDEKYTMIEATGTHLQNIDFSQLRAFTGEDEKFAFRRAVSRLWEVCSDGWWRGVEWTPVKREGRSWEGGVKAGTGLQKDETGAENRFRGGLDVGDETKESGTKGPSHIHAYGVIHSPYRTHPQSPPKFGIEHFWSMVMWGKRAGAWGKGVEGLKGRKIVQDLEKEDGGEKK